MSKGGLQSLLTPRDSGLLLTHHHPFAMNSEAEIQQATEDYRLGRMGAINSWMSEDGRSGKRMAQAEAEDTQSASRSTGKIMDIVYGFCRSAPPECS